MKKLLILVLFLNISFAFSQKKSDNFSNYIFDISSYYGSILKHKPGISHLITAHPTGVLFGISKKTNGKKEWEKIYNYPDYGVSFYSQNYRNEKLGKLYAIHGHYTFYFRKQEKKNQIALKVGTGLSYVTNPYDKLENWKNNVFGSHVNASLFFNLYYQRLQLFKNIGLQAGVTLMHNSNGSSKSPNSGTNVFAGFIGLNYSLKTPKKYTEEKETTTIPKSERLKFNIILSTGRNETDLIGNGKYPFYTFTGYIDKRVSNKSAIQFGFQYFNSKFLKEHIYYKSLVDDPNQAEKLPDYKRASLIIGHELFLNKLSAILQVGYYVYYPFPFEGRVYENLGFKYYFSKTIFVQTLLKAHAAKAESFEFGIGCRI